jgi:hypothetical protein
MTILTTGRRSRKTRAAKSPTGARHGRIHKDEIDIVACNQADRAVVAIACVSDNSHVRLVVDQQPQAFSNRRMVFGQDDSQRGVHQWSSPLPAQTAEVLT